VERGLDADPRLGALFAALLDRASDGSTPELSGVDDDIPLPPLCRATDPLNAAPRA
jgi:hypothetical protein